MGSNSYIPEYVSASRIVAHGKIESLANGFSLPNKEGFTIYARPKVGAEIATPDIVLSVKCMTDDKAAEIPVRLNEWNKLYLESIAPNADILESVDLYWGTGFSITKGKGKYYTEPTAVSTRYSGEAQALVTAGSGTGVVKYRLNGGEWSDSVPTATNVGVYKVEYKMEANDLYEGIEPKTLRCTIAEKFVNDPTIELTPSSFTYNGSPCVPSVVVKDGQRVIPTAEYTVEISNNINAGTANVVIKDNIAGNYEVIGSTTFNIAKAARTISFTSAPSSVDVGDTVEVAAAVSAGGGNISYFSSDENVATVEGNVVNGVAQGTCNIIASVAANANYEGATAQYQITAVPLDYSAKYLTFVPVEDSTFGFSEDGLSYSTDNGSTWTELAANGTTPTVTAGSKIMWKNNTTLTPSSNNGIGTFSSSKKFDAQGNIMSLFFGDNFVGQTSLSGKNHAFKGLFYNGNIRNANNLILPATTLAVYCCGSMFKDCTSLTTAPELPATTLSGSCYQFMFKGCTHLNYVKMLATDISAIGCLSDWLSGVAATGTFVKADGVEIPSGSSGIPSGWTVNSYVPFSEDYLTFIPVEDSTFGFSKAGLSYSLDEGRHWTELAANGTTPTVAVGKKIMWKNNTTLTPTSSDGIGTFTSSKNFDVEGNIMSLLYGDNFVGQTSLNGEGSVFRYLFKNSKVRKAESLVLPAKKVTSNGYTSMFNGCSSLISVPELPATTLESRSYAYMFQGCTSLTTAQNILPAMTLTINCYYYMFNGCTSLASAPELPATSLSASCYENMFSGCTSLTTAPNILPATTLFDSCYASMFRGCTSLASAPELSATTLESRCCENMFSGCTSLTTAPNTLPATTLANSCYYYMFNGCRSLTSAPELPATTLANGCYNSMFIDCTSLTTAPVLPATTLTDNCYYQMFQGCTNINYVKMLATDISASSCLSGWLSRASATGTFVKADGVEIPEGASGIPSGWTVEIAA